VDPAIAKPLVDKMYEKRKAAALELEKLVRECHQAHDEKRIGQIVDQLIDMFSLTSNALHVRNGGLIGLAGTAIALGVDIAPYMERFLHPLLNCFSDPENRVRYFAAECLYNIAKVSKGEVLVYFNPIFDALSKLAADPELSVKNGAELLDRLLKDIVAESASFYVPHYPETVKVRDRDFGEHSIVVPHPEAADGIQDPEKRAFSLARFIPLLSDRIYVISPFTRSFLVSWITVLDSVPELELITYLPEFLDGLLKYLSDPTEDVRIATDNQLAELLREIKEVTIVQKRREAEQRLKDSTAALPPELEVADDSGRHTPDELGTGPESSAFIKDDVYEGLQTEQEGEVSLNNNDTEYPWVPGQGVKLNYDAIVEILLEQLNLGHDEIQQSTALLWLAEFLTFAEGVMVPFTPRLIPAILPNLAHHVPMIQNTAKRANKLLSQVIQSLPSPSEQPSRQNTSASTSRTNPSSPPPPRSPTPPRPPTLPPTQLPLTRDAVSQPGVPRDSISDAFDYQATVNALTLQFLSEHEETRVAALKWLIMLHQKAPKKILAMDDGTFPALLKTLSDSSEEACGLLHDLQLLAQISSTSDDSYFREFMINLLNLFSTDKKLLETRGSLIIRQLCLNLNTDRVYKAFAEILEKEEDLEFASVIVTKLSMILITSPELADFRRRLKTIETRQDGQALFVTLYRSWCHNAVSVFSLCLLAQAYEHASNLLGIFAELEITVSLLVQIDKLVQLIESPVFTYLRLQLLEPDRNPYLFKCLYGLLMLLPQSTAFVALRNRLNAVNSAGFLHIAPKPAATSISSRSKLVRDEIKWGELLLHFRTVQSKHEKARRQAMGTSFDNTTSFPPFSPLPAETTPTRPPVRRRVTGSGEPPPQNVAPLNPVTNRPPSRSGGLLSPLNPRSRVQGGLPPSSLTVSAPPNTGAKPKRTLGLTGRKT
ncbi:vacuolar protein 14 C-terminal Fig4p binding-domain-containing protein, partial [Vararia minispora EC-137]